MGGVAGAVGPEHLIAARPSEPRWLAGGEAQLAVVGGAPTIWLVSIEDATARARAEGVMLTASDRLAFAARHDAGERLLRRALAKLLLASAAECLAEAVTLDRNAAGAPVVATPRGWHLSVAASWPDCAIGIARQPLGIDLERVTGEPIAWDLLTPAERDGLAELPVAEQASAFVSCWAAKEAHAKWTRYPRRLDPASIQAGAAATISSPLGVTRCWRRFDGDIVAAVCTG